VGGRVALSPGFGVFVARRRPVLVALTVLTIVGAALTTRIETRFDPEELVAIDAELRRDRDEIQARFGTDPIPVLVLFDARESGVSLLEDTSLAEVHDVARQLARLDGVVSVDGLTTTPLPSAAEDDANLEELEAEVDDSEVLLRAVVTSDPERFPLGLMSLEGAPPTVAAVAGAAPLPAGAAAEVRAVLAATPLLRRRLASEDGRVVVLAITPRPELDRLAEGQLLASVRRVADAAQRPGLRVSATGLAAMRVEMRDALVNDQGRLVGLAFLGTILVLILGMRSLAGVVLPLGAVGISLALVMGTMSATGTPLDLLTNMLPPLLLTIGLAEAMHMVVRYRDELALTTDRVAAAVATVRHMWLPCFVTTFTTAIGFAALIVSESEALRRFGLVASSATMLGYAITVIFVPAALPSFGAPGAQTKDGPQRARHLEGALVQVADAVSRRPWTTIVGSLAIGLSALVVARDLEVESRLLDQFARGSEVARTSALLEEELDGFRGLDLVLEGRPGAFHSPEGMELLETVAAAAHEHVEVIRVTTAADWAREALARVTGHREEPAGPFASTEQITALLALVARADTAMLARYITGSGDSARVELRVRDLGASRTLALVESLRAVATRAPVTRVLVGGEAYAASRGLERIVSALGGLGAAVLTIFVVMALLFRSVRLGLLSIPPNLLPLLVTLAYMVMRDIALHAATVIVFTVTVGLSVDGTTHVVSRFREELVEAERLGRARADVLRRTVAGSGRAVLLSSVTLIVGYAALLSSSFEPVRLFGELSAVSIVGATISQTIFLPALLSVWGAPRAQIERRPSNDDVKAESSGK